MIIDRIYCFIYPVYYHQAELVVGIILVVVGTCILTYGVKGLLDSFKNPRPTTCNKNHSDKYNENTNYYKNDEFPPSHIR